MAEIPVDVLLQLKDNLSAGLAHVNNALEGTKKQAVETSVSFKDMAVGMSGVATSGFALYMTIDRVEKSQYALDKATLGLTRSNESLDQAQKNVNEAIAKYGVGSIQAKDAADKLSIAQEANALANERVSLAQNNVNQAIMQGALSIIPTMITMVASASSVLMSLTGTQTLAAAGQKLLNLAMEANPILIVVAAITALIAVLVTLYFTCQPVRDFFDGLGRSLGILPPAMTDVEREAERMANVLAFAAEQTKLEAEHARTAAFAQANFTNTLLDSAREVSSYDELLTRNCNTLSDYRGLTAEASAAVEDMQKRMEALAADCEATNKALETQITNLGAGSAAVSLMGRDTDRTTASEREFSSEIERLNQQIIDNVNLTADQIAGMRTRIVELEAEAEHTKQMADLLEELGTSYNVLQAQADTSLEAIHAAYDDCFAVGNFEAMAKMVEDFAVKHNISLDDAKATIEDYEKAVKTIPLTIAEQLVGRAQEHLETFKNCATGKMLNIKDDNKAAWDTIVADTNSLISSGLVGQAQANIKAFVDCSTGKQAQMVDDVSGYLKAMVAEYDANTVKINALVAAGKTREAQIYINANNELLTKILQMEKWRNEIVQGAWNQTNGIVQAGLDFELAAVAAALRSLQELQAQFGQAGVDMRRISAEARALNAQAALELAQSQFGAGGVDYREINRLSRLATAANAESLSLSSAQADSILASYREPLVAVTSTVETFADAVASSTDSVESNLEGLTRAQEAELESQVRAQKAATDKWVGYADVLKSDFFDRVTVESEAFTGRVNAIALEMVATWDDTSEKSEISYMRLTSQIQGFANKWGLTWEEAHAIIVEAADGIDAEMKRIPESIEQQLIGKAQADFQKFEDCMTGKSASLASIASADIEGMAQNITDLINAGLVGEAQAEMQAYVDCNTDKLSTMAIDITGMMEKLTADHIAQVQKMRDYAETLTGEEKIAVLLQIEELTQQYNAKMQQLRDWQAAILAQMKLDIDDFVGSVAYARAAIEALMTGAPVEGPILFKGGPSAVKGEGPTPMALGGIVESPTLALLGEHGKEAVIPLEDYGLGRGGGSTINITITGPIVQITGSADKATAEYAADLVEERLKSVLVEASSSGAPATSKNIRRRVAI